MTDSKLTWRAVAVIGRYFKGIWGPKLLTNFHHWIIYYHYHLDSSSKVVTQVLPSVKTTFTYWNTFALAITRCPALGGFLRKSRMASFRNFGILVEHKYMLFCRWKVHLHQSIDERIYCYWQLAKNSWKMTKVLVFLTYIFILLFTWYHICMLCYQMIVSGCSKEKY